MPSRAYVAHDRAVSAARMYVRMAVVGFLLASVLYAAVMTAFLSRYVAEPIPEMRFVDGKPRLHVSPGSPRLPVFSLLKYYASLNPKNYLSVPLNSKRLGGPDKREVVEPELQPFFRRRGSAEGNLPERDPLDHPGAGGTVLTSWSVRDAARPAPHPIRA